MIGRRRWLAVLAGAALALVTASAVFGYAGQVAAEVSVSGAGPSMQCGVALTITATILDKDGKPIADQPVAWEFTSGPSSKDVIHQKSTTTDADGVATTSVTLACVAGDRHLRATADNATGGAVLGVTAAGLPNTSTLPSQTPLGGQPGLAMVFAVMAGLAGAWLLLRKLSRAPR